MSDLGREGCSNLSKWSFLGLFSGFGHFSHVLGEVKEWLISKLHEMIRVLLAVACPIDFNSLFGRGQQGGVLKLTKNDQFLVFLVFESLSRSFWAGEGIAYIKIA